MSGAWATGMDREISEGYLWHISTSKEAIMAHNLFLADPGGALPLL